MAAANFITTIRPRHNDIGLDRRIAQCVAARMHPQDLLIVAEWGWPDYLEYLRARMSLNVVNNFGSIKEWSQNGRNNLGTVYITDPNAYSNEHIEWLESQSGVRRADLTKLAASPAFSCYGRNIFFGRVPQNAKP